LFVKLSGGDEFPLGDASLRGLIFCDFGRPGGNWLRNTWGVVVKGRFNLIVIELQRSVWFNVMKQCNEMVWVWVLAY